MTDKLQYPDGNSFYYFFMRTIFKYEITPGLIGSNIELQMPKNSTVRHFSLQREILCLWAEVDIDAVYESRKFAIFATGQEIPVGVEYVGTVTYTYGLVWHLYEYIIPKT